MTVPLAVAILLLITSALLLGVKHVHDPERLLIFRLGQPRRVAGPGVVLLIPAVDRGWRVDLDQAVPEWRSLAEPELIARLLEYGARPAPPGR